MKFIIMGTAGHVDHGKTALIKALTGIETDCLKEEKVRGISIDLGFANMKLDSMVTVGIVDVPGHERFLKNMLAGTGGIDVALLVIAADEGIMPQTREHMAMLELYGIKHGVIAITKIDKVDKEWLDFVEEEVKLFLTNTFLENAPLSRVSTVTQEGLEELKSQLLTVAKDAASRDQESPFRLWIDRVFSVKGYGVVVTGSVLSGTAKVEDHLLLYPSGVGVRVRGLECHGHKVEKVVAGQRAALNLVGIEKRQIERGMSLCSKEWGEISCTWDVLVTLERPCPSGTRVRLHLGTGEFLGRIYSYKDASKDYMRLILEKKIAGNAGDKGIIRLYSPQYLLGGLMLIAPNKGNRNIGEARKELGQALHNAAVDQVIHQVLVDKGSAMSIEELLRFTGCMSQFQIEKSLVVLEKTRKITNLDYYYIDQEVLTLVTSHCTKLLEDYHMKEPLRAGVAKEVIKEKLQLKDKAFEKIIVYWLKEGIISKYEGEYGLCQHIQKIKDWYSDLPFRIEKTFDKEDIINIDRDILSRKLEIAPDKAQDVHEILLKKGVLIQIDKICIYRQTIQHIISAVSQLFQKQESFTIGQLRDMLNTSRKILLPIVEYLDMNKYTVRQGDIRCPGPKMVDFIEK